MQQIDRDGWSAPASAALLLAVVWFVFEGALEHDFVNLDDPGYVSGNPAVQRGLDATAWREVWTETLGAYWHPLTGISHRLDVELFGDDAGGHHLTSVVLHTLNALLAFLALHALTRRKWPSLFASALFALHPLRVESVVWVCERKDVLSGAFFFLTLMAWARYARRPGPWRYAAVVLAIAGGLASKPMFVTTPCVLLLLDIWPLNRWPENGVADAWRIRRRLIYEKLPLLALTAAVSVVTFFAQRDVGAVSTVGSPLERIAHAFSAYLAYVRMTLWPTELAVIYPHPLIVTPEISRVLPGLLSLAFLSVISAIAFRWRRQRPYVLVGWLWFLGMLVPVIGLVQTGNQAWADRFTYLPHMGFFVIIAWGLAELIERRPQLRLALTGLALLALTACAWSARRQVPVWSNSTTLFQHAIAVTDKNFMAHTQLGLEHLAQGRRAEAREQLALAVEIHPSDFTARFDLGVVLLEMDNLVAAQQHLLVAAELRPNNSGAWNNLAIAFSANGQRDKAIAALEHAVEIEPHDLRAQLNRAMLCMNSGQLMRARPALEAVVQLDPTRWSAHRDLGLILGRAGEASKAVQHLERAIQGDPSDVHARRELAWVLATTSNRRIRNPRTARSIAQAASRETGGKNPTFLAALAAAHAANGAFDEAIETLESALELGLRSVRKSELWLRSYRRGEALFLPK